MTRVLLVHNFYQIPGGEDSIVRSELSLLRDGRADALLFSVTNDTIDGPLQRAATALKVVYNPWARHALAKQLKQLSPDVVHVHNFFPLLSPSVFDACRDLGIPSVLTLHNFRILCPTALLGADDAERERSLRQPCWWTVPRRTYRNSATATVAVAGMVEFHKRMGTWVNKVDRFIALTNWARQTFIRGGLPADRIVVKPNWVPVPYRPGNPERDGALFVGRLAEEKGISVLLQAWQDLDCKLRIIGDGPLAEMVRQANNSNITYLGRQPSEIVHREMQSARCLVLPSVGFEMFPLTVLEAFANSLPVVCSDLPSLGDLVEQDVTGLKFAPGNPTALAETVRAACGDPTALDRMGQRARMLYAARYTPESNAEQLLGIYRSVRCASRNQA